MIIGLIDMPGGVRHILLGLSRENLNRLMKGDDILLRHSTHPGMPKDIEVGIMFGETEQDVANQLVKLDLIGPGTQIRGLE